VREIVPRVGANKYHLSFVGNWESKNVTGNFMGEVADRRCSLTEEAGALS